MTLCNEAYASTEAKSRGLNIRIIMTFCNAEHSAIKLNRTDTTLDLSQRQRELKKKEKRRKFWGQGHLLIVILRAVGFCHYSQMRQTTTYARLIKHVKGNVMITTITVDIRVILCTALAIDNTIGGQTCKMSTGIGVF